MNKAKPQLAIRRILVALDASANSLVRLETAAELAQDFKAELIGLFVEDVNLLRLAQLPFAREISLFSSTIRRFRLEELQRELRAQSNRMRQALAAVAARRNVPWIFKVVQGSVAAEVLSAASEADLMILGKVTWSFRGGKRVGSTVRMILLHGRGLTLILQEGEGLKLPVLVIYDGSDLARKALDVAGQLVQSRDSHLSVFILAPDKDIAQSLQVEVFEELQRRTLGADFHLLIRPSLARLAWLVQTKGKGPVVLPCGGGLLQGEGLCALANEVANPLLLVR
jgi:nucleotide-binding universal stress UspA family protein